MLSKPVKWLDRLQPLFHKTLQRCCQVVKKFDYRDNSDIFNFIGNTELFY